MRLSQARLPAVVARRWAALAALYAEGAGPLDRGGWWLGVGLVAASLALAGFVFKAVGTPPPVVRGLGIALAILALLPLDALHRRRLAARGRPAWLARIMVAPATVSLVLAAFGLAPAGQVWLGVAILAAGLWMVVELGLLPDRRPVPGRGGTAAA